MPPERTTDTGPELTPEQQFLGILAADDGDTPEPVGDEADETIDEHEGDEPEGDEVEEATEEPSEEDESDDVGEEDDEEDEQEPHPTPRHKVRVDGQEVEVTLDELKAGYSRQRDYTRKTQELAEQRRQFEEAQQSISGERQQYLQVLQQLQQEQALTAQQEPNWDLEYQRDPVEATRKERAYRQQREKQAVLIQQQQMALARHQQEQEVWQQQAIQKQLETSRKELGDRIPEWKDPVVAKKEREAMRDLLYDVGYGDEDIGQIYDHRVVLLLRDAMKYRRMQEKRANARPSPEPSSAPKVARPQASRTPTDVGKTSLKKQRQRLAQTGSIEDAATLFENLI